VLIPKAATTRKLAEALSTSYHTVSSQMGCKEQSAFTRFARHERPKGKDFVAMLQVWMLICP
jgi:hypothetical protein